MSNVRHSIPTRTARGDYRRVSPFNRVSSEGGRTGSREEAVRERSGSPPVAVASPPRRVRSIGCAAPDAARSRTFPLPPPAGSGSTYSRIACPAILSLFIRRSRPDLFHTS
jgi:hypothetical protein